MAARSARAPRKPLRVPVGLQPLLQGSTLTSVQRSFQLCYSCAGGTSDAALVECDCPAKQFGVSSVAIGTMAGGMGFGVAADVLGRRRAFLTSDLFFLMGAAAMCLAPPERVGLFFAGRIISGMALSGAGSTASAYIAEIAPPSVRGRLMQVNELAACMGCVAAYVVAAALGDEHWRCTAGIPGALALIQMQGVALALPESGRRLPARSQPERRRGAGIQALEVGLRVLAGLDKQLIELGRHWRPLLLAVGCALAQNFTDANTALYHSRTVMQRAGVHSPLPANIGVGVVKFLGIATTLALVDRVGRRALLIAGTCGVVLSCVGLVAAFAADPEAPTSWLALVVMLALVLSWNVSWAGLMRLVAGELLPQPVRCAGLGVVFFAFWALSFLEEQTFLTPLRPPSPAGTFGLFGCTFCLPETGGRSLEAIAEGAPNAGPSKEGQERLVYEALDEESPAPKHTEPSGSDGDSDGDSSAGGSDSGTTD
eukprot:CAMPEP_0175727468 /NCGR_PEP_ID=MMETSP0097-20121207/48792_1 /TAXON_ID=311494 /ORGANISM="Alexandrium monilatum, Strain CCMP3105" /LENGTH=483 /DNA_ID=CAMNT_0017035277 /DNA_START=54 /DNA_END=1506 /DNA_ORIENTATION=-